MTTVDAETTVSRSPGADAETTVSRSPGADAETDVSRWDWSLGGGSHGFTGRHRPWNADRAGKAQLTLFWKPTVVASVHR